MRRRRCTPMFFIARTVAPMFTESSSDSVIGPLPLPLDRGEAVVVLAIAAEVDEFAVAAAEHQLPASPVTTAGHFVDDEVDRREFSRIEVDVHAIAVSHSLPHRMRRR